MVEATENAERLTAEMKGNFSPSSELALLKEAYNAKVEEVKGLEQRLVDTERLASQGKNPSFRLLRQ